MDTNLNTFLPQTEIAVIFDFDITLTPKYMQSIIFDRFNIDENNFWSETEDLKLQGYDSEHAYIKNLISYIRSGKINKLSNQDLIKLGSELEFHKGFPNILDRLKDIPDQTNEISPKVKFYVISSGFEDMIKGSKVYPRLKRLWGCTFDENEKGNIDFPKETISSTTKTQKLFLINKGLLKNEDSLSVNDFMPYESRPVPFKNMIYVGDGPTDVPCFSLLMQNGGQSVAVYEPKDKKAFDECYRLVVESKRADVMCPADYSEDSQLYLSLSKMIEKISDNINSDIENSKSKGLIKSPEHLN